MASTSLDHRQTLASLVADWEGKGKDIAVVEHRGVRIRATSYFNLARLASRFAAELLERRIQKGDRVLLWGENSAEWVAAFFGCVMQGVLPVPLDQTSSLPFVKRVSADVHPKLVVADTVHLDELSTSVPSLALDTLQASITHSRAGARNDLKPDDALQIIFTSGTTGDPKGIVHTHRNVLASLVPIEREMQKYLKYERIFHPIRILHSLPLSHVFGQFMGLWIPTLLHAEVHFESRLVPAEMVRYIKHGRVSVLAAVPRVLELFERYLMERIPNLPERIARSQTFNAWQRWWHFRDVHRLFGLKFWAFVCGGASLAPDREQFWRALGFVVVQGYGMTETTALVSLNHPFRAAQGTIGQVLPGREVKLNEEGEVLVRGDTISTTSWQNGQLQEQGSEWLATGDLAEFDQGGNLRFRGRKKDVIVSASGLNIYPEDLEAPLKRQPGVRQAAVIETPGEHGPEPMAVLLAESESEAANAVSSANQALAEFQQIRRWLVWPEPELPRTSTGKVLKREISRRIANGEIESSQPGNPSDSALQLDSLGRVQLQAQLERQLGVTLDDAAVQEVQTKADLAEVIRRTSTRLPASRTRHIYPRWPWNSVQQAIRTAFLEIIAMPLVRFLGQPMVRLQVAHWPSEPILIVANHITSYDAAFVLYALPKRLRRRTAIAMSGEMLLDFRRGRNQGNWFLNLAGPVAYFLMTALFNVFPLPQRSGFRDSFRHAGEAMDRGYNVLVFPEGRRSDDGTPQPFKSGAGLLWKELGSPALSVNLSGLGELKQRSRGWFRSGKIGVTVNNLLTAAANATPEALTRFLEAAVFEDQSASLTLTKDAQDLMPDSAKERAAEHADR